VSESGRPDGRGAARSRATSSKARSSTTGSPRGTGPNPEPVEHWVKAKRSG
jgi:hypothetical protein